MKILRKIITAIFILSFILLLADCGKPKPSQEAAKKEKENVERLNKEKGGIGLPYNFQGANRNQNTITPISE